MPRYRVKTYRTVVDEITVEAADEDEAQDKAFEIPDDDWVILRSSVDDVEITEVE